MQLYHGSKRKFSSFDFSYVGENGTSEGKGFYFTDSIKIAKRYGLDGYLYRADLKLKTGIDEKGIKFSKEQYRELFIEIDKKTDYLSCYGDISYEGLERVVNRALDSEYDNCESDVDILGSIATACGDLEAVNRTAFEVLGITHIVVEEATWGEQMIVIALVPEVIEILEIEDNF